jgi:hypothetical protein
LLAFGGGSNDNLNKHTIGASDTTRPLCVSYDHRESSSPEKEKEGKENREEKGEGEGKECMMMTYI